jgi:hypothetical protein
MSVKLFLSRRLFAKKLVARGSSQVQLASLAQVQGKQFPDERRLVAIVLQFGIF